MADVSTATSYMISDLPVKQAPSGTDIFLLEDAEGNAYQVPASALALSSEQVTAAINAWLAAHPEATTTVVDGSITMQKLAIDVTGAFQSLSDDIDDLETALGNKVPYPTSSGGTVIYGTAGQALLSKGDGTTVWGAGGGGLSDEAKDAILDAFEHVAWIDDQGQDYVDAIRDAFYPPVHATSVTLNKNSLSFTALNQSQTLVATVHPSDATDTVVWSSSDTSVATVNDGVVTTVAYGTATITATAGSVSATCSVVVAQATLTSISAVYTQSGTVYDTDSLDSLKTDLVVTATWSDSSTSTVAASDYTLSGTLTEGTSTITVTYGGKTTTFNVTVTEWQPITETFTWSGSGTDKTGAPLIDARNYDVYFSIPFVQGATELPSTATAESDAVAIKFKLYNDAEGTSFAGWYWIDIGEVNSTSRTGVNTPKLKFDTKTLVAPKGYYVQPFVVKQSSGFASNSACTTYLNAHANEVELR